MLAHLAGTVLASDETNALKTGYDPVARSWGQWIGAAGWTRTFCPRCALPGSLGGVWTMGPGPGAPKGAMLHAD